VPPIAKIAAVCAHLPEYLHPVVRFGFVTRWRKDEVLSLQWQNADFQTRSVRLNSGTKKSGHGRDFPFTATLEQLIRDQYEKNRELKKRGKLCPWVFPKPDGTRIGEFRKSWSTACRKSGVPGRLFHDLRRSAVRGFVRAGIPQTVAMKLSGHRTDSVFRRYDVVSEEDLTIAARLLEEADSKVKVSVKVGR